MKDFEDAFKSGIDAARQVKFREQEISSVLKEFSASLELSTGGELVVELRGAQSQTTNVLREILEAGKKRRWLAIVVKDAPNNFETVAEWRQSLEGYPCTIVTPEQEVACFDKVSLQVELSRLAASPQMGAAIMRLWDFQSQE